MQGRLSPVVDGKIQAFPWEHWRKEFELAEQNGFSVMEWTIDSHGFHDNPLLTAGGRSEIGHLKEKYGVSIPSLTGDCFMQDPFFKKSGRAAERLLHDLGDLVVACGDVGIGQILIPLVDNGHIENPRQEERLMSGLREIEPLLRLRRVSITFESDLPPDRLIKFVDPFDPVFFGITYDIGNSAACGFNPVNEIRTYGHRILNVHVKDRVFKGGTVPLGEGDADIPLALCLMRELEYAGNYILQTARAADGDHVGVLSAYKAMVNTWLKEDWEQKWI